MWREAAQWRSNGLALNAGAAPFGAQRTVRPWRCAGRADRALRFIYQGD